MATEMKPGDVIPIRFVGATLPDCEGIIERVDGAIVHFRYTRDSPIFGGLRGMLRLPGWSAK